MNDIIDYKDEAIMLTEADRYTSHEMLVMALKYMSQDDVKDMLESNDVELLDFEGLNNAMK
tara:strand:- start:519 stop:701 length:183 start_codon:yes stop_codon:yes gene_type:complete